MKARYPAGVKTFRLLIALLALTLTASPAAAVYVQPRPCCCCGAITWAG